MAAHHDADAPEGAPLPATFARGVAMGVADVIPGVSGGTVALILGIYQTLIDAIRSLASAGVALLRGRRHDAAAAWGSVPWRFVLPLGAGIVVALGVGLSLLAPLLETYPTETSAVFFGMIVASLVVPWRQAGRDPRSLAVAAACAIGAFLLTGLPEVAAEGDLPTWRILGSAAIAICAMILPGISGAFLLVAMGAYEATGDAVRELDVVYVATFALGAVVGLGAFSKLLSHLLSRHLAVTMAGLTGLMLGALRRLWPWGGHEGQLLAPPDAGSAVVVVALVVLGMGAVTALLRVGDRRVVAAPAAVRSEDTGA